MLGWQRGQPSRLLPFIKSPEAQGIFRLRQSTKASDFLSRQDPSCSERAKHGSCRELGEVIGPYRGTRAPAVNQIDQPLQARVATWGDEVSFLTLRKDNPSDALRAKGVSWPHHETLTAMTARRSGSFVQPAHRHQLRQVMIGIAEHRINRG
jgi:hypothetical protein